MELADAAPQGRGCGRGRWDVTRGRRRPGQARCARRAYGAAPGPRRPRV